VNLVLVEVWHASVLLLRCTNNLYIYTIKHDVNLISQIDHKAGCASERDYLVNVWLLPLPEPHTASRHHSSTFQIWSLSFSGCKKPRWRPLLSKMATAKVLNSKMSFHPPIGDSVPMSASYVQSMVATCKHSDRYHHILHCTFKKDFLIRQWELMECSYKNG